MIINQSQPSRLNKDGRNLFAQTLQSQEILTTTREVEYDLGRTSCLYCHRNAFPQGISGTLQSCSSVLKTPWKDRMGMLSC